MNEPVPVYYLAKIATTFDKTLSKTFYLADRRDNVWTATSTCPVKRFWSDILAEQDKSYYERQEKHYPSFSDATVEYKIVTECPYDNYEEALADREKVLKRLRGELK